MGFELFALISGDGVWNAKTGYPGRKESMSNRFSSAIGKRGDFRPARKTIDNIDRWILLMEEVGQLNPDGYFENDIEV